MNAPIAKLDSPPYADLRRYVRVYDNDFSPELCKQLLDGYHGLPQFQVANGAGVRPGLEQSGWTELNVDRHADANFRNFFYGRLAQAYDRYNQEMGLSLRISPPRKFAELIIKRYKPGGTENFQTHFDALGEVCNRYLVFLWYLNDVEEGGETCFVDLDLKVQPRAGRLLMFPPYWMYQHCAAAPISGDKYIISTYALY